MRTLLIICLLSGIASPGHASTTIDPTNRFAYGANIGWINWQGDISNGAVIGEYVCSGFIYSANAGWISLGSGAPANGIQYQNDSANDYGLNHDGLGHLRGLAYSANIGWINFEDIGAPAFDLLTGKFSGYAWSANCGWISLSNAFAYVQTDTIADGEDADRDRIPDAFELTYTGSVSVLDGSTDSDGDGVSDLDEYLADTDPLDPNENLRIVRITRGSPTPGYTTLQWTSKPTRRYAVQHRSMLGTGLPWSDFEVLKSPGAGDAKFNELDVQHFYRIRAFRPLTR